MVDSPTPEPSERLVDFANELNSELAGVATVEPTDSPGRGFSVKPSHPDALGVEWVDFGLEIVLYVEGGLGGRWELDSSNNDIDMLQAIVRSVVAGRVREVRAMRRSCVTVTLEDGTTLTETGAVAPEGCLPLPFWKRWGRRVEYSPYRP